ncbi:MAG: hypothetical protein ACI8Y4_005448 [Candidatus Poriferisodalaceae bacterium]
MKTALLNYMVTLVRIPLQQETNVRSDFAAATNEFRRLARPTRGMRGRGPGRRRQGDPVPVTHDELRAWFIGSLPDDWFEGPVELAFDRDEIIATGALAAPSLGDQASADDVPDRNDDQQVAEQARIASFRADTRARRVSVAERAEALYERKVTWGASCGDTTTLFTTAKVPVMTRLNFEDRATLDTLIDAGVARSRAEALAWCVQLVADNEGAWIAELREAMSNVEQARAKGPASTRA